MPIKPELSLDPSGNLAGVVKKPTPDAPFSGDIPKPAAPGSSGISLPFLSATSQNSPVFDDQAGKQAVATAKAKAADIKVPEPLAKSVLSPPATKPISIAPAPVLGPTQPTEQEAKDRMMAAAVATPGVIQQGSGLAKGETAYTTKDTGRPDQGVPMKTEKPGDVTKAPDMPSQGQITEQTKPDSEEMKAAAVKAGVSAYYDSGLGVWVNSSTGLPQVPRADGPIGSDPTYGSTKGDIITNGGSQYYGLTVGQANAIEKAGQDVADKYNPVIQAQKRKAGEDEANSLISGGQAGGLLNSQISGSAATSIGGTWAGAGGSLKRLQDEYDRSIQQLQDEESKAINAAKDASTLAARTGKSTNSDAAYAAARNVETIQGNMAAFAKDKLAQMKALSDIKSLESGDATNTISNLISSGYKVDDLPKEYIDDLDAHLQAGGAPPGSVRMLFATGAKLKAAQDITDAQARQKAEIDNVKNIVGVLKDVPSGKTIQIGDQVYTGLSKGDMVTGNETNAQGKVTHWAIDQSDPTSKPIITDLGYIGSPKDGWMNVQTDQGWYSYNPTTKQSIPLQPSQVQTNVQQLFPEGSKTNPFRPQNGDSGVQCGELQNDCNDPAIGKVWGNTLQEKLTAAKGKNPLTGESWAVSAAEAKVGDTVVQDGGDTGHVLRILDIHKDAEGKPQWTTFEANRLPPGGGQISSTRQVSPDDAHNLAVARVPTRYGLFGGTDTKPTQPGLTLGGKPISEILGKDTQKTVDATLALLSKGTLTLDSASKRLSRLGIDPSQYTDELADASSQGHLTKAQKEETLTRTKANVTAAQARTVNSVLSPLGFRTDPSVVGYKTARANINRIYAADNQMKKLDPEYKQSNAALDLELADAYVRMATGNAVTEAQVHTLQTAQGLVEQGKNFLAQKKYGGFLSPETRKSIISLSTELLDETKKSSDEAISEIYQPALDQYGVSFKINPDDLVRAQDGGITGNANDPLGLDIVDSESSSEGQNNDPLSVL